MMKSTANILRTNAIAGNENDDLSVTALKDDRKLSFWGSLKYTIVGAVFGTVFVKAQVISWFRIQEMFRFQSFHMYGVIGTAIIVGVISVFIIKRFNIKTLSGESISFHDKTFNKGQIFGGIIFGLGWALTGACPGPLFAQLGAGAFVVIVVILFALAGTWVFGFFKDNLPY